MRLAWFCCTAALTLSGWLGAQEPETVQHVQKGEFFAAQGRLDLAIEEYEKAMAAGAGSATFLNRLGDFYLQAQGFDQAVEVLHRSLRERPGQLPVYSKLGEAFLGAGRLDSAIYYVEQARRLVPEASPVHSSLGFLYLQLGEINRAKAHLDTALLLDPQNPEAHRFLGFYYAQADSLDRAIEHYLTITELLPKDVEAHNNIAFLYAQQRKYSQALEYYKKAKERAVEPYMVHTITTNLEAVRAIMEGKMRARYILVKTQTEARDLLQRLREGEDFGRLAQQFSQAPNARDGGDAGFFGPGELLEEFEEAVLQLEVGEISEVVGVPMGFMVIQRLN